MTAALRLLVAGLACLALVAPQASAAQDRSPSAAELRKTYPLDTSPRAETAATRTAVPSSAPADQPATTSDRTVIQFALLALLSALAFAAGFALSVGPLRRRREPVAARPPAPVRRLDPPLLSTSSVPRAPSARPPATRRAWTAEIAWRRIEAEPRFCVIARSDRRADEVTLMMSTPLEWPPTGPDGVQALTDAAEALEVTLLDAGWTALPPGDAWYEKRFAWQPVDAAPDRFSRTPARVSSA